MPTQTQKRTTKKLDWPTFRLEIKKQYYTLPAHVNAGVKEKTVNVVKECAKRHLGEVIPVVFLLHAYESLSGKQMSSKGKDVKGFREKLTRYRDELLGIGIGVQSITGTKGEPCVKLVTKDSHWAALPIKAEFERKLNGQIQRAKLIDAIITLPTASAPTNLKPEDIKAAQDWDRESREGHNKYKPLNVPCLPLPNKANKA